MKMETPKMDVVRFQEADVIVASGIVNNRKRAALYGWENGIAGDATLTFSDADGNNASVHTYSELHGDPEIYDLTFINGAGTPVSLTDLATDENSYGAFNGSYQRGDDGKYYWQ